jgi:Ca-activated chloride channel family protein
MKKQPLKLLLLGLLCSLLLPSVHAQTVAEPARVIIVFDASGSMAGEVEGRAKIDIAKEVVSGIVSGIAPEVELGLMAYGHRRKGDCEDIELLVPPAAATSVRILSAISKLKPIGKTPLTASVIQAAGFLKYTESKASVILVSDGEETCDMDPCAAALELEATGIDFTCHVVGFDIKSGQSSGLECLAKQTGGLYLSANNADSLTNALQEAVKQVMKPSSILVVEPKLASGGEIIDGVSFQVRTPQGAELASGSGGRWSVELEEAGQFVVTAERDGKKVKIEAEVGSGKTATYEVIFTETGLKAVAYEKEGGVAFASGVAWTLLGVANSSGERTQVAFSYDGKPFLRVDPGTYLLRAERGSAVAEKEVTVGEGAPLEVNLILGSGSLKLSATAKVGEPALTKDLAWDILGPPDAEGDRKSVAISYDANPTLTIPAGKYLVRVSFGDATGQAEVEVKAGEQTEVVISLESGKIKAAASMEAGGTPLETDLAWEVLGEADAEGNRKSVAISYDAQPTLSLPAGTYLLTVAHGSARANREVTVVAGETIDVALTLGAGSLRLSARSAAGAPTLSEDLAWNVFGETDSEGNRADVAFSYDANPTLSIPAGTYLVRVTWGEVKVEQEVIMESGKLKELDLILSAGTIKANAIMGEGGSPVTGSLAWNLLTTEDPEGNRKDAGFSYENEPRFRNPAGKYLLKLVRGSAMAEVEVAVTPNKETSVTVNLNAGVLKVKSSGEGLWTIFGVPENGEGELKDLGFSYESEATFYVPAGKIIVRREQGEKKVEQEVEIAANKLIEITLQAK